jgi:hypothetical protein
MKAKKTTFAQPLSFYLINELTSLVHYSFPKSDVNLSFKISKYSISEAIQFLSDWGFSLPEKPTFAVSNQKRFGYPFPMIRNKESIRRR